MAVAAPAALAQSTGATIRGQVMADSAPAAEGTVTARNVDTGLTRTSQISGGNYNLPGLPPGTYTIDVTANGQATSQTVTVAVGQTATLNLGVGGVAETAAPGEATDLDTVTVTAPPALVETKTSEVATYVTQAQIENLPQNSRNFLAFADTVPGMLFTDNGSESRLRSGAQGANNINVFIDGVGQKNYVTPGGITGQDDSPGNPFPQSAIGEFKVITSNYKAEYDQISSAAITAVTRSGTNDFRGAVFWDRYTEAWREPTPDEEDAGSKTEEKYEQYGAWVGGAIVKDRLHYFLSYEGKDIIRPVTIEPPTQVDPATLPESIRNEYGPASRPFESDLYFGKLSWQASDDHLIEFSARRREEVNLSGIGGTGARSYATDIPNDETRFDLRSVYSTMDWMNDAHVTYESAGYNPRPVEQNTSARYTVIDPNNPSNLTLTVLNSGSGGSFQDKTQKGWGFQNDFTWYGWEGHTLKAGFKYKKVDLKAFQQFPPYPRYWYDVNESLTQPYRVEFTSPRTGRDPFVSTGNTQFGLYVQDDWEVTDKLTLNLGIRWDVEDNPSYTDRVLDPAIVTALENYPNIRNTDYDIQDYISNGRNRKNDKDNFAPRLGFSYDLSGDQRHVVFGGAGRSYDRTIFDYMAREYYGGAFTTYTINFPTALHPCRGTGCVPFDPALLTPEGLAAYTAANPVAGGEIQLLNNDFETPYADQYSLGMRNLFELWGHEWNSSVTLQHIRSRDNFYMRLGTRRPDGSFHEFEDLGQTWGNAPFSSSFPVGGGYTGLLLGDNGFAFNQNSLLVSLDKPYTEASPWGFGLAYTFTDGEENRPNASEGETYLFDYARVRDQYYTSTGVPRHRLVLTGIYSPGWGLTFSSKLVLQSPIPISAVNNTRSPANGTCTPITGVPNCGSLNSFYAPVTPDGTIGYKQFDLAAEKRFELPHDFSFKIRADVLNVFNWRNWNQFDTSWGPAGGPVNPDVGSVSGNNIDGPTRTFKLSAKLEW